MIIYINYRSTGLEAYTETMSAYLIKSTLGNRQHIQPTTMDNQANIYLRQAII